MKAAVLKTVKAQAFLGSNPNLSVSSPAYLDKNIIASGAPPSMYLEGRGNLYLSAILIITRSCPPESVTLATPPIASSFSMLYL